MSRSKTYSKIASISLKNERFGTNLDFFENVCISFFISFFTHVFTQVFTEVFTESSHGGFHGEAVGGFLTNALTEIILVTGFWCDFLSHKCYYTSGGVGRVARVAGGVGRRPPRIVVPTEVAQKNFFSKKMEVNFHGRNSAEGLVAAYHIL